MSLAAYLTQDALKHWLLNAYAIDSAYARLRQVYNNSLSQTTPPPPPPLPRSPKSPLPRTPCSNGNAQGPQTAPHAKQAGWIHAIAGHGQCT